MAHLGQKDGIFHARFTFCGKEYKKSLKTDVEVSAQAARRSIELTIHRLHTGLLTVPEGVDPGDYIVSGGSLTMPVKKIEAKPATMLSVRQLITEYLKSHENHLADTTHATVTIHLRHLERHLGSLVDGPATRLGPRELAGFLEARLRVRDPNTVRKERVSLIQLGKWLVSQNHLEVSPAAGLAPIKGGVDRPPFRTISEIEAIIKRGGLNEEEVLDLWGCLYLCPEEIAELLTTVRDNAELDYTYLLHAIPAYSGMRRGEVLRLRWLDVDLDLDCLYARSRKQSRSKREVVRRIDLHPELKQELLAWRLQRPKGQFVICDAESLQPLAKDMANRGFWMPMRDTKWCLNKSRQRYMVGFHTYRHSFCSNLAARGIDQRVIDEFVGHTSEAMRRRYRHLFPKDRHPAIESFSLAAKPESDPGEQHVN